MYEQSFETEFIAGSDEHVFDTDFTTSDDVFDTGFISEDDVFDTLFEVEEQVFDTSFESEEPVFETEFEAVVSEGGTCLPNVTGEDDGKVLKVQKGKWSVGDDDATPLSNLDIEALLKNFR